MIIYSTHEALWMMSEKSWTVPSVSGYWKMIPPMSLLEKSTLLTSTISILMPKGPALVSTQLMVCGWSLSDRRNLDRKVGLGTVSLISPLPFVDSVAEPESLRSRGALVQERGVGHVEPREVGDHGLVVEERLQPALGDLRLVGRVLSGPARVLEHVPEDRVGNTRPVVTHPYVGPHHHVPVGYPLDPLDQLVLGERLVQAKVPVELDVVRDGCVGQVVQGVVAELPQHGPEISTTCFNNQVVTPLTGSL